MPHARSPRLRTGRGGHHHRRRPAGAAGAPLGRPLPPVPPRIVTHPARATPRPPRGSGPPPTSHAPARWRRQRTARRQPPPPHGGASLGQHGRRPFRARGGGEAAPPAHSGRPLATHRSAPVRGGAEHHTPVDRPRRQAASPATGLPPVALHRQSGRWGGKRFLGIAAPVEDGRTSSRSAQLPAPSPPRGAPLSCGAPPPPPDAPASHCRRPCRTLCRAARRGATLPAACSVRRRGVPSGGHPCSSERAPTHAPSLARTVGLESRLPVTSVIVLYICTHREGWFEHERRRPSSPAVRTLCFATPKV